LLPGHHQRLRRGTRPQGGSEQALQTCSSWTGTSHTMMPQNEQQPTQQSRTDLSSLIFLWMEKKHECRLQNRCSLERQSTCHQTNIPPNSTDFASKTKRCNKGYTNSYMNMKNKEHGHICRDQAASKLL
jgi:hypothetical protein